MNSLPPYLTETPESELEWFEALLSLARYLRSENGCPWDRKQTPQSFSKFVVEEAEELREAAEEGDNEHLREELGDTFFGCLMTAVVAEQEGRLSLKETFERAHQKMVRRHAHLFGDRTAQTPEDVVDIWQQVKAEERREREL